MSLAALDTETLLILPGCPAPPIVCGSWQAEGGVPGLSGMPAILDRAEEILRSGWTAVLADAPFDLACLMRARPSLARPIFDALRGGRVHDVITAQALDAIWYGTLGIDPRTGGPLRKPSTGKESKRYSLEVVCDLVLGRVDAKARDVYRMSYGLFVGVSIDRLPVEAREYMRDDVRNPLDVAIAQLHGQPGRHVFKPVPRIPGDMKFLDDEACEHCGKYVHGDDLGIVDHGEPCPKAPPRIPHRNLGNLAAQVEAAFALHLGACWSLRTDPEKVEALIAEVEEKHARAVERFRGNGWVREDGSEDQAAVKKSVAVAYGATGACPRCRGSGKIRPRKIKPCRGQKARGRYLGCGGAACTVCGGEEKIEYLGNEVTCGVGDGDYRCPHLDCGEPQYAHPGGGGATCPRGHRATAPTRVTGCDGTGLNLRGATLPRTEKGRISANRDTLLESGDDDLAAYGENEYEKIRTTQLPWLRTGINRPLSYSVNAVLASGRASYEGSPVHQMTREGGERECIRARGAWCGHPVECVLGSSDYGAGELCALGIYLQYLFGHSEMLRYINESGDPGMLHSVLGAEVLGIRLDEFLLRLKTDKAIKLVRQAMKPPGFGRPAAMGAAKIALNARLKANGFTVSEAGPARNRKGESGYWGIRFCITIGGAKRCGETKVVEWNRRPTSPLCKACVEIVERTIFPAYNKRFPEIADYHAWGKRAVKHGPALSQSVLWSEEAGRPVVIRERLVPKGELSTFLNNPFQSMVADITKRAAVIATRECYLGEKDDGSPSPLGGVRLPIVSHDELVSEMPLAIADAAGRRITEVMESTGTKYAPACKAWKADTALAFWLSKAMEPCTDPTTGKLIPWDREKMDAWRARHPGVGEGRVAA